MLAGTREGTRSVDRQGFADQWQKPTVAGRLRAIGLEKPELLGTLFLGDAEFLRKWTGSALPLTDNHPHRIYPEIPYTTKSPDSRAEEYLRVMAASGAQSRFEQSDLVKRLWPSQTRERTLNHFVYQEILNTHLTQGGAGIPELYFLLTESDLRSLPLMLMATDEEDRPILEKAVRMGVQDPTLDYLLAAHALSVRDYTRAVQHFDRALARDPASLELARFRILALVLSGQRDEARKSADGLRARRGAEEHGRFWPWLETILQDSSSTGG